MNDRLDKHGYMTRVISFKLMKDDAEAFDKCVTNKSILLRFFIKAIISQDTQTIQKIEELIKTRPDELDEFPRPSARPWPNNGTSISGDVELDRLMKMS